MRGQLKWAARILAALGITPPAGLLAVEVLKSSSAGQVPVSHDVQVAFWLVWLLVALAIAALVLLVRREARAVPLRPRKPLSADQAAQMVREAQGRGRAPEPARLQWPAVPPQPAPPPPVPLAELSEADEDDLTGV
jgi:hypothetical protein